eukprot:scaffold474_cov169-Ochromonas_danica.AAC.20
MSSAVYTNEEEDFEEDTTYDEEDSNNLSLENSDDQSSSPMTASLQIMITRKMRGQLEALGYQPEEIAAVVIERALRRPASGMPLSWRRPGMPEEKEKKGSHLRRAGERLAQSLDKALTFSKVYVRPFLPAVVLASAVWFQRDSLGYLFKSFWKSLRGLHFSRSPSPVRENKQPKRRVFGGTIQVPSLGTPSKQKKGTVDVAKLSKLSKLSPWERIGLKVREWRL